MLIAERACEDVAGGHRGAMAAAISLISRAVVEPGRVAMLRDVRIDTHERFVGLLALLRARPASVKYIRAVRRGWPLALRAGPRSLLKHVTVAEWDELAQLATSVRELEVVGTDATSVTIVRAVSERADELRSLSCANNGVQGAESINAVAAAVRRHARTLVHLSLAFSLSTAAPDIALPLLRHLELKFAEKGRAAFTRQFFDYAPRLREISVTALASDFDDSIGGMSDPLAARVTSLHVRSHALCDPRASDTLDRFVRLRELVVDGYGYGAPELSAAQWRPVPPHVEALKIKHKADSALQGLLDLLSSETGWLPGLRALAAVHIKRGEHEIHADLVARLRELAAQRGLDCIIEQL